MEYAKDEIFKIRYNEYANRLEIGNVKKRGIHKFVKEHKIMSMIILTTIVAIGVNCVLIHEFFSLLSTL